MSHAGSAATHSLRYQPRGGAIAGLVLLGRRELTASQLRERLLRKGYPDASVAEAIDRLTARGLVDDARAAGARARHGVVVHRRGRARVLREVKSLGVPDETARRAVAAAFDEVDEDRMVAEAVQRKLRAPRFRRTRVNGSASTAGSSGRDSTRTASSVC